MQPLEHTTVRVKVKLAEPVPDGMVGRLHLAWYDPDNTLANEPSPPPSHNGHGRRDNVPSRGGEESYRTAGCLAGGAFGLTGLVMHLLITQDIEIRNSLGGESVVERRGNP